jgi:hypothetical protein
MTGFQKERETHTGPGLVSGSAWQARGPATANAGDHIRLLQKARSRERKRTAG